MIWRHVVFSIHKVSVHQRKRFFFFFVYCCVHIICICRLEKQVRKNQYTWQLAMSFFSQSPDCVQEKIKTKIGLYQWTFVDVLNVSADTKENKEIYVPSKTAERSATNNLTPRVLFTKQLFRRETSILLLLFIL